MPFQQILDQLKNKDEIEYPQDPRTPTSFAPNENVTKALLNIIGDKHQDEGVTESMSPIDFLPVNEIASLAGRGIKAGAQGLMEAAPRLVGNEIGAIGNLKPVAYESPTLGKNLVEEGNQAVSDITKSQFPKLESVLDPSKEARMARAKEMGFDPNKTYYHGTTGDIENFSPDFLGTNTKANSAKKAYFFTSDPSTASDYSSIGPTREHLAKIAELENARKQFSDLFASKPRWFHGHSTPEEEQALNSIRDKIINLSKEEKNMPYNLYEKDANVLPVHLKTENPLIHDYQGQEYRDKSFSDLIDEAKKLGHDSVVFKNAYDPALNTNQVPQDIIAVLDPSQIRSTNAMFDPAKKSSGNILAGLGGAALLGSQMDDDKFSELNKLLNQK